jgi:hypothetical protein
MNNDRTVGLLAGDFLDRLDGHRHGEQLADVGFGNVKGHVCAQRFAAKSASAFL